jgi:cellulose synthase/poly-beta-1,6-N-acetylglucosamine synthase-like glycosyltransferase
MEVWFLVELVTLILSVPVLGLSYYWCFLLGTSIKYPRDLGKREVHLLNFPKVSILIATFNEKFVIDRSLEAMKHLDYPKDKIQVVVADDSTDETVHVIDQKALELNRCGIKTIVSRRPTREHFKCGALNKAMECVRGEYVLLLDADSIIPPDILSKGIDALESHERAGFVSFRYGHYNRDYNMVTRLFALSQDLGDTTSKMGSYLVDSPFSFQGGFTLVRAKDLREVGQWSNERIADDTDISIKLYLKGMRGIYLSNVTIMSEDPSTLEAWKKQVARTSQGWWRCIAKYWKQIIFAHNISLRKRLGLFLMLTAPFSSLSWILVTFLTAFAIICNIIAPPNSIFSNPIYLAVLTIPYAISLFSGVWALWVQGLLSARNLILIPMLSYAEGAMLTLSTLGFFYGVFDRMGFFLYRTPHAGGAEHMTKTHYFQSLANDRNAIIEGILAVGGIILGLFVLLHGMWFLAISMSGFGLCTLKSMNLTRGLNAEKVGEMPRDLAPELVQPSWKHMQLTPGYNSNVSGLFLLNSLRANEAEV